MSFIFSCFPNCGCCDFLSSSFMSSKSIHFKKTGLTITIENQILGEGAYSIVYKARGNNNSNQYAIKKMFIQSKEYEKIVQDEIDSLLRFNHSNIIKMIDSNSNIYHNETKIAYILFQFIPNGSLRNILNKRLDGLQNRQNLRIILKDFIKLCDAFNVLHNHIPSYVHQDIKPENILISDDGSPLLTDFGSTRLANIEIINRNKSLEIADEAAQFCTISYRSPELFDPPKGSFLDSRTDVWGIGCLLFAWWFGYSPFECEFINGDSKNIRVVECTYLRVLAPIKRPLNPSHDDNIILILVEWILNRDLYNRPFTSDIIIRINQTLKNLGQEYSDLPA